MIRWFCTKNPKFRCALEHNSTYSNKHEKSDNSTWPLLTWSHSKTKSSIWSTRCCRQAAADLKMLVDRVLSISVLRYSTEVVMNSNPAALYEQWDPASVDCLLENKRFKVTVWVCTSVVKELWLLSVTSLPQIIIFIEFGLPCRQIKRLYLLFWNDLKGFIFSWIKAYSLSRTPPNPQCI